MNFKQALKASIHLMNEQNSLLDYEPVVDTTPRRPVFLSVLCILSWVGAGFSVVSGVFSYWALQSMRGVFSELNKLPSSEAIGGLEKMFRYAEEILIITLACALVEIIGVVMMWKLRKTGFFLYVLSVVIAAVVPGMLMGFSSYLFVGTASAIVGYVFTAAFITMYAVNLRHMR